MTLTTRVTVYADGPGLFNPDSFDGLLRTRITLPGLDPTWQHTLLDVVVAEDGASAELVVESEPEVATAVEGIRLVDGTPPAKVRVVDETGARLAETALPAPLIEGQEIELGGTHYRVVEIAWPNRHPDSRSCLRGDYDWQVATVVPAPRPPVTPVATQ
jgi:hypothetical protein